MFLYKKCCLKICFFINQLKNVVSLQKYGFPLTWYSTTIPINIPWLLLTQRPLQHNVLIIIKEIRISIADFLCFVPIYCWVLLLSTLSHKYQIQRCTSEIQATGSQIIVFDWVSSFHREYICAYALWFWLVFFLGVMTSPIYGNPDRWYLACIHDLSRYYPIDLPIPKSLSSDFVIASLKGT